jgi:hypothetical protein
MNKLLLAALLILAPLAHGAEEFTYWESQTFTAPFTDGIVATSSTQVKGQYEAVQITLLYEEILPIDGSASITAVLEREVAPGVWVPVASQFEPIRNHNYAPTRFIVLSPQPNFNPGGDVVIIGDVPQGARMSSTFGILPDTFRTILRVTDSVGNPLQSVTISGSGQKF